MKHAKSILVFLLLLFFTWTAALAQDQARKTNWDAFSKNLVAALASGNEGLQLSAMGMIIRYSDSLNVKDAAFDIIRVFKFHKNPNARRLAMVTLHKIGHPYAMYFLKRQIQFEKEDCIRKHCCCIVKDYYANKTKPEKPADLTIAQDSR
ncbi:MAG: hypothetical protein P8184_16470 [Calditrichia bacterium]